MRIFFAGPLTNLKERTKTKTFYDNLSLVAQEEGFDFFWAFRNATDPVLNPEVSPDSVYKADMKELLASDVMVAYVGEASTGTGEEVEIAKTHNIPVVLLFRKDQHVSRILRGNPAVKKELVFITETEALSQFRMLLKSFIQDPKAFTG